MDIRPIVRAVLAVGAVGATIYMLIAGIDMHDGWWVAVGAIIAFYFATKEV